MLLLHAIQHVATATPDWHIIPGIALQLAKGPAAYDDIMKFSKSILSLVRSIGLVVFLISISIAAMMRMMSFGGQQRIMFANLALTSAVIGLIVLALASVIEGIVTHFFPV
ncbi:MAG: hypothetical protein J2P36_06235 [Ktedonobacteraceae bacterium]|nr:hypothetical protein [Ktedonobacteraceae bacterium]